MTRVDLSSPSGSPISAACGSALLPLPGSANARFGESSCTLGTLPGELIWIDMFQFLPVLEILQLRSASPSWNQKEVVLHLLGTTKPEKYAVFANYDVIHVRREFRECIRAEIESKPALRKSVACLHVLICCSSRGTWFRRFPKEIHHLVKCLTSHFATAKEHSVKDSISRTFDRWANRAMRQSAKADKAFRHLFARGLVQILQDESLPGRGAGTLTKCHAGLGRFNEACVEALLGMLLTHNNYTAVDALRVLVEASSTSSMLQKLNESLRFLRPHSTCSLMRNLITFCLLHFQRGKNAEE